MSVKNEKTFYYLAPIAAYILASAEMIMDGSSTVPFLLALMVHGLFRLIILKLNALDCGGENGGVKKPNLIETE